MKQANVSPMPIISQARMDRIQALIDEQYARLGIQREKEAA